MFFYRSKLDEGDLLGMVTDMVLKKNIKNIHQYQIRALILMDIKKLLEFNPNKYIEDEQLILNTCY